MDFIEIFSEYSPKQLRSGEIQMQCPFRENHDADSQGRRQMYANPEKNLYHCFSCGKRGTLLSLLTTKFEISLSVAVELINDKFIEDIIKEPEKETYECVTYKPEYILNHEVFPEEFLQRGFSEELLKEMKIGVSNIEGVATITIPLFQGGRLVGVKYRSLGNKEFWYSENFEKRKFIYHEPEGKKIVVVESETDTLQSITNGITWVGAVLGTEVSPHQIHRLAKYERIYSAFDNDDAGFMATEKFYLKTRKLDAEILFVPYESNDPGDCPKGKWMQGLTGATDYAEYSYVMASIIGDKYFEMQRLAKKMVLK